MQYVERPRRIRKKLDKANKAKGSRICPAAPTTSNAGVCRREKPEQVHLAYYSQGGFNGRNFNDQSTGFRMYYSNASWAYLERARACLAEKAPRYLMYAAFEFRCFLEARQHEYLIAQKEYRRRLPKHWKTGEQGKELGQIFKSDRIQSIELYFDDGFATCARYVPVSEDLRQSIERLNTFRHSLQESLESEALAALKKQLEIILPLAEECLSGNMLSPVFMPKNGGFLRFAVFNEVDVKELSEMNKRLKDQTKVLAKVSYEEPLSLQ